MTEAQVRAAKELEAAIHRFNRALLEAAKVGVRPVGPGLTSYCFVREGGAVALQFDHGGILMGSPADGRG